MGRREVRFICDWKETLLYYHVGKSGNKYNNIAIEVLTAVGTKSSVFWDKTLCSRVLEEHFASIVK
jgi:hypothetical protein